MTKLWSTWHLAGKSSGVLATAVMAQMELDYAQYVVEEISNKIRCILTTDAKSAFQSASIPTQSPLSSLQADTTATRYYAPMIP